MRNSRDSNAISNQGENAIMSEDNKDYETGDLDRRDAIETAVRELGSGDVLLVAGKGHETGQTAAGKTIPFSDHEAVATALERLGQ